MHLTTNSILILFAYSDVSSIVIVKLLFRIFIVHSKARISRNWGFDFTK